MQEVRYRARGHDTGQFAPRTYAQFGVDSREVMLHRLGAYKELGGRFPVGIALGHLERHLQLLSSEVGERLCKAPLSRGTILVL